MLFDFEKFEDIAASVYPETPYSFEESMSVFKYFFSKYEQVMGYPHPPIKANQIVRICQKMPFISCEEKGGSIADVDADEYCKPISTLIRRSFRRFVTSTATMQPCCSSLRSTARSTATGT